MIAVFYNVLINTSAYILLLVLGWKMHRYTVTNLQLNGVSSQQRKSAQLNRQLNHVLIIQVHLFVTADSHISIQQHYNVGLGGDRVPGRGRAGTPAVFARGGETGRGLSSTRGRGSGTGRRGIPVSPSC